MRLRFLSSTLALALVAGCGADAADPPSAEACIPLDSATIDREIGSIPAAAAGKLYD